MTIQIGTIIYRDEKSKQITCVKPLYTKRTKELEMAEKRLRAEASRMFSTKLKGEKK